MSNLKITVEETVSTLDGGYITKTMVTETNNYNETIEDVTELFSNCVMIGDKGYIGRQHQINLFETAGIELEVPLRNNQKGQRPVMWILKKVRKRIETVFSQLCDQFMIQRNYAKSFTGFKSRILAKITGLTVLQFLNKFINNQPVGRVKHALAN